MWQRYSAKQWSEFLREQAASGLTIQDFCDAIGVSTNTFYSWRRKLRKPIAVSVADGAESVNFLPVSIVAPGRSADSWDVRVDLPCGAVLRVPADSDILTTVLTVLLSSSESSSC